MKILLVSLNYSPEQTGIGKYQGEMAAWLAARGHQVRAVAAPPYYPEWRVAAGYSAARYAVEEIAGVRVTRVPLYVPPKPGGLKRILHLASFALTSLPVLLAQGLFWRPQAVVLTAPPLFAAPGALLARALSGGRAFLHVQDFEVDAAFNLGLLKTRWLRSLALWLERRAFAAFDATSTVSPRMRDKLLEKGVPPARAYLLANWANTESCTPDMAPGDWPQRLKPGPGQVLALYSGNLGRKQGLETIVEAARLLAGDTRIRFVICGDGAGREDMVNSAQGLPNITFLPVQPMEGFFTLIAAADIHLLPQRAAAADLVMPSKLGNMLASGRPVVAGALPGTQLYDAVSGCGLAVPPDDAPAFARAIAQLAGDAALRTAMGANGRARAEEEWGKEAILRRMEAMLTGAAKG